MRIRMLVAGGLAALFFMELRVPIWSQAPQPPTLATDITAAEVQAVLKAPTGGGDRQMKVVDMGKYNVSVGVLHRGRTTAGAPVSAINHEHVTEVYYIISGAGTLVTGGTVDNIRPLAADSEVAEGGRRPQQPRHVPAAGAKPQSRARGHRDHPARRVSRLYRCRRSRGLRLGASGSGSCPACRLRASVAEEIVVDWRAYETSD